MAAAPEIRQQTKTPEQGPEGKLRILRDPFAYLTIDVTHVYEDPEEHKFVLRCKTGKRGEHEGIVILSQDMNDVSEVTVLLPSATAYNESSDLYLPVRYVQLNLLSDGRTGLNHNYRCDHGKTTLFSQPTAEISETRQSQIDSEMVNRFGPPLKMGGFQGEVTAVLDAIAAIPAVPLDIPLSPIVSGRERLVPAKFPTPQFLTDQPTSEKINESDSAEIERETAFPTPQFLTDQPTSGEITESDSAEIERERAFPTPQILTDQPTSGEITESDSAETERKTAIQVSHDIAAAIAANRRATSERFLPMQDSSIRPKGLSITPHGMQVGYAYYHPKSDRNSATVRAVIEHPTTDARSSNQPQVPSITFTILNANCDRLIISAGADGRIISTFVSDNQPPHRVGRQETWIYNMIARLTEGMEASMNHFSPEIAATISFVTEGLQRALDKYGGTPAKVDGSSEEKNLLPQGWSERNVTVTKITRASEKEDPRTAIFAITGTDGTPHSEVTIAPQLSGNNILLTIRNSPQTDRIPIRSFRITASDALEVFDMESKLWVTAPQSMQAAVMKLIAKGLQPALERRSDEFLRSLAVVTKIRSLARPRNMGRRIADLQKQLLTPTAMQQKHAPASLALIPSPYPVASEMGEPWDRKVGALRALREKIALGNDRLTENAITGLHQMHQRRQDQLRHQPEQNKHAA